ncbi:MAG TPA: Uma2 family endonuclease [Thermoanaerobaculia bacterium]|nr:Uma2 family endonuclease [Thermoanaerobaculia bacterium]
MSQPIRALAPLPFELVYDDGEPLDSPWHRDQITLALDLIPQAMEEQGRTDFYTGGNNFVYYSVEQAREVALEEEDPGRKKTAFRGPDIFWVGGVDPTRDREAWIAWEEDDRLPDLIIELLSPKTAKNDRTVKKDLYARVFRTSEYFLYDPKHRKLEGFRLAAPGTYRPLLPDADGRFWSEQLGLSIGLWHGVWMRSEADWIRLFRPDGSLVATRVEAEREQKQAERRRAERAEAELARLRAPLGERDSS